MIEVFRGDDLSLTFYFKEDDGSAIDLTGCTLFGTIKSSVEDPDASAKISKYLSILAPATGGVATLSATATEMLYLRGRYVMDIQIKTAGGVIQTAFKSDFYVKEDVTIRTV